MSFSLSLPEEWHSCHKAACFYLLLSSETLKSCSLDNKCLAWMSAGGGESSSTPARPPLWWWRSAFGGASDVIRGDKTSISRWPTKETFSKVFNPDKTLLSSSLTFFLKRADHLTQNIFTHQPLQTLVRPGHLLPEETLRLQLIKDQPQPLFQELHLLTSWTLLFDLSAAS